MTRSQNMADQLLEHLRHRLRVAAAFIYLLYFVFWYLLSRPYSNLFVGEPRTWLALVALVVLAASASSPESPTRSRPFMWFMGALAFIITLVMAYQALQNTGSLIDAFTWLNLMLVLCFFSFGPTGGVVVSSASLLGLSALTLTGTGSSANPFIQTQQLTCLFTALLSSTLGYLCIKFIQEHLTLHEQATDELAAAKKDALTGVLGRAAIEEELRRYTRLAQKNGTPLSIIVTDIDHFKRVNDQFGHGAGDDVLRSFAKRLRRNVGGSGGIVGRWGGEEFVVLLPTVARPDALAMAERLRHEVSNSEVAGHPITASFGVASYRSAGDDVNSLFGRADERLYDAKNAGRNAVRG